jgi:hypothetical protein
MPLVGAVMVDRYPPPSTRGLLHLLVEPENDSFPDNTLHKCKIFSHTESIAIESDFAHERRLDTVSVSDRLRESFSDLYSSA